MVVEIAESSFVPRHRSPQPEASGTILPPLYHDFVVTNDLFVPQYDAPQADVDRMPPAYTAWVYR